ncbi:hypothetical protein [Paenibacillus sp. FSL R7-0179]|uniref:hypothetical protein n=1 Tax=Paenibacillus sp. FSL R7-0179 TaxID=2921672 RepID=UPI0030FB9F47
MSEKMYLRMKAIAQVALVVILHLGIITFLRIKTEEWQEVEGMEMVLTYCAPVFLLYATCIRSLKIKKLRYNLIWFLISLLPSVAILFKLKEAAGAEPSESAFIVFPLEQGYLELMWFFPVVYSVIQLLLWASMWFMILSKE